MVAKYGRKVQTIPHTLADNFLRTNSLTQLGAQLGDKYHPIKIIYVLPPHHANHNDAEWLHFACSYICSEKILRQQISFRKLFKIRNERSTSDVSNI